MSGGDWRNAVIVLINLAVAAVVWYPFFKAADKDMAEKEIIKEKEKAAKKAAKLAAKQAKVTEE